MTEKEIERILNLHRMASKLKTTLRSGWLGWKVTEDRIESIAEHVFGGCMLAIGIYSTTKKDVDIDKVIAMLMLHETEEIYIGDITLFDVDAMKTKREKGREAALKVFDGFDYADKFLDIIEEFEVGETKEAKFAYQCDKLEADMQAYLYDGHFDLSKVSDVIKYDDRILKLQSEGFNTVPEYFLQHDKPKFTDECLEIANYLEKQQKFNKSK